MLGHFFVYNQKLSPKFANKKGGEEDARTKNQRNLQAL